MGCDAALVGERSGGKTGFISARLHNGSEGGVRQEVGKNVVDSLFEQ